MKKLLILSFILLFVSGCGSKSSMINDIAQSNIDERRTVIEAELNSTEEPTAKPSVTATPSPQATKAPIRATVKRVLRTAVPAKVKATSKPASTPKPTATSKPELEIDIDSIGEGSEAYRSSINGTTAILYPGNPEKPNYNTLLIGDSLTCGLYSSADLNGARVFAHSGVHTMDVKQELQDYAYDYLTADIEKIIITLGSNDRGEDIYSYYGELLVFLKNISQNADIYINLIPYANEAKAAAAGYASISREDFDKTNNCIRSLSDYVHDLHISEILQESWCVKVLSDEMLTTDGLHFTQNMYRKWAKRLYEKELLKMSQ